MEIKDSITIIAKGGSFYLTLNEPVLIDLYCYNRKKVLQLVESCAEKNFRENITLEALHIFAGEGYEKANEYINSTIIGHEPRFMLRKGVYNNSYLIIGTSEHCYELACIDMNTQGPIPNLVKQLPECPYRDTFLSYDRISRKQKIQRILSMTTEEIAFLHKSFMYLENLSATIARVKAEKALVNLLEKPKETFLKEATAMMDQTVKKAQRREKAKKRREENYSRIGDSIEKGGYYKTPHGYILPFYETFISRIYFFAHNGNAYTYDSYGIGEEEYRNKLYTLSRGKTPTKGRQIKPNSVELEKLGKIDNGLAVKIKLVSSGSQ